MAVAKSGVDAFAMTGAAIPSGQACSAAKTSLTPYRVRLASFLGYATGLLVIMLAAMAIFMIMVMCDAAIVLIVFMLSSGACPLPSLDKGPAPGSVAFTCTCAPRIRSGHTRH